MPWPKKIFGRVQMRSKSRFGIKKPWRPDFGQGPVEGVQGGSSERVRVHLVPELGSCLGRFRDLIFLSSLGSECDGDSRGNVLCVGARSSPFVLGYMEHRSKDTTSGPSSNCQKKMSGLVQPDHRVFGVAWHTSFLRSMLRVTLLTRKKVSDKQRDVTCR